MDIEFSTPPGDSKVIAVSRIVNFSQSQEPTIENLRSSLTAKFGQPTYQFEVASRFQGMDWGWDKAGQISKPSGQPNACSAVFLSQFSNPLETEDMARLMDSLHSSISTLQQENDTGCAIGVAVRIVPDPYSIANGKLAKTLRMALIDPHDALQAEIATNNYLNQIKKAQAEEELKKARANKPPL